MIELTIRNKAKSPVFTLRPPVLGALLNARPEASSLVLTKYSKDYKQLTGKSIHLYHEQQLQLLQRYGADSSGMWTSRFSKNPAPWFFVERCFVDGFLKSAISSSLLDNLAIVEAFFDLLERQMQENS
ncbi:hypothetical protein LC612_29330 [Nostoc sp. CHAB 5834]|nr:hypothetical protein [Nostoc sp. CHAB 5834]